MDKELLKQAEGLWQARDKINKFSTKFNTFPYKEATRVVRGFEKLSQDLPQIASVANKEELYQEELRRRLNGEAIYLDHFLSGTSFSYEEILDILGILPRDISRLRPWLAENKEQTLEAIERKFQTTNIDSYQEPVDLDDPDMEREAEGISRNTISKYHTHLGKMIGKQTKAGEYLRDIRAVPNKRHRSGFNLLTKKLAISIPDICYVTEDDSIHINEGELVRLIGHEGMGHALKKVITDTRTDLPFFLRESSNGTIAAEESVTQYYETVIFEDLRRSPKTQKDLKIDHNFSQIYQDHIDTQAITQYQRNLYAYAITVLANKDLGYHQDPQAVSRKIELIREVSLEPLYAYGVVTEARHRFDADGNLDYGFVHEMRYSDKSVKDSLAVFQANGVDYDGEGRSKIDLVFLTGYWTPHGFRENARLAATNP